MEERHGTNPFSKRSAGGTHASGKQFYLFRVHLADEALQVFGFGQVHQRRMILRGAAELMIGSLQTLIFTPNLPPPRPSIPSSDELIRKHEMNAVRKGQDTLVPAP